MNTRKSSGGGLWERKKNENGIKNFSSVRALRILNSKKKKSNFIIVRQKMIHFYHCSKFKCTQNIFQFTWLLIVERKVSFT